MIIKTIAAVVAARLAVFAAGFAGGGRIGEPRPPLDFGYPSVVWPVTRCCSGETLVRCPTGYKSNPWRHLSFEHVVVDDDGLFLDDYMRPVFVRGGLDN